MHESMRILSITAGAAAMYCGSCLRDNALAAELIARGHDVTLLPLYTPLLTDEPNVTPARRALRRHQRLPAAAVVAVPTAAAVRRSAARLAAAHQDVRRSIGVGRPEAARRPDDLDARRPDGVLRKEFDKLVEWVARRAAARRREPPNSMLIGLARPLADALGARSAARCRARTVSRGAGRTLPEPRARAAFGRRWPTSIGSSRSATTARRSCRSTCGFPPTGCRSCRSASTLTGLRGRTARCRDAERSRAQRRRAQRRSRSAIFARVAPEKGLHLLADAFIRLRRKRAGKTSRPARGGRLPGRGAQAVSRRSAANARARGLLGDFTYHGAVDRAGKIAFLQRHRRAVGAGHLRRTQGAVPARGHGERRAGRAAAARRVHRRSSRGPAAACWSRPDDPDASPRACAASGTTGAARRARRAADARASGAHYTVQRSADALIRVYEQVIGNGGGGAITDKQRLLRCVSVPVRRLVR